MKEADNYRIRSMKIRQLLSDIPRGLLMASSIVSLVSAIALIAVLLWLRSAGVI